MFNHKTLLHSLHKRLFVEHYLWKDFKGYGKNKFILHLILRIFSFYAMRYQKAYYKVNEGS